MMEGAGVLSLASSKREFPGKRRLPAAVATPKGSVAQASLCPWAGDAE